MKIIFPQGPAESAKAIIPAVQAAIQAQLLSTGTPAGKRGAASLRLSGAFRGYSLNLDTLAAGKTLSHAVAGLWHRLVFINGEAVADAQLTCCGDKAVFSGLNCGPVAAATIAALHRAEKAASLRSKSMELRLLSAPALHFVALWLHSNDGQMFIPIAPTPDALVVKGLIDEDSLFSALIPAAQELKQKFDADTTGLRAN